MHERFWKDPFDAAFLWQKYHWPVELVRSDLEWTDAEMLESEIF